MPDPLGRIDDHALPDWLKYIRHDQLGSRPYDTVALSEEQADQLQEAGESYQGYLNRIRPHKNEDGLEYAQELIASLHNENASHSRLAQKFNLAEEPKKFAFELVLNDETVEFHWGLPDTIEQREFRQQVSGLYPNSEIKPVKNKFPEIEPGMHVSGGKLELHSEKYRPIKGTNGLDQFESDPYQSILSELVGYSDEVAIVQFVFTPASDKWTEGHKLHEFSADQINDSLTYGRVRGSYWSPRLDDPSSKDLRAADAVLNQEGKQAFYVNIRYLVFASSADIAKHHAHGIGSIFSSIYHNNEIDQTFTPLAYHGDGLLEEARRAAGREFHYDQTALTVEELAAAAHLPGDGVESTNVDWTRKGAGNRPPAQAKRTVKPPDMAYQRDTSSVSGDALAMSSLSSDSAEESDTVSSDTSESDSLLWKGAEVLARFLFDDKTDDSDTGGADSAQNVITVDTPEKQEAFNDVYRQFINGQLTREKIKARYNEHVADNLLRKFRERRADEMGIDLEDLEDGSIFDQPGARNTPEKKPEQTEEPATQSDETDTGETTDTRGQDPDQENTVPDDVETTSGLPETVQQPDSLPEKSEAGLPTTDRRGMDNSAHHAHYVYDQADSDVQFRREPGLQQYFPFELKSFASGTEYAEEGDVFAGFDVRDRLMHSHKDNPDEPIWLGYDSNPMDGIREIGLEPFSWFRHATVFGSTGKGKSTTLNNIMNQIARKGHGYVFIDPKGDTVDDLITQLPDDRMDDIIWVEPGSETFEQVAGINFLEPGNCETEKEFNREVESIIDDLRAVLRGGEYWGPKMEGITCNIARAMIRSRRKFTLVDMYYVLAESESRAKFSNVVSQEGMTFIHEYTTKIAQMDDEEIDPILRRIQDWVEDPISRGIVAHRDGTINISDAVEEGKIILVRNTIRSDEIRKVVSTGIMRRVWSTIRKREKMPEAEREPFFAIMDEFDDIASENMALDKMLSKARSGKMGVITCLQNPSQVRDFAPQTLKQMFGNSDTLISFGVTEVDDAKIIAERFDDENIDSSTFMSLPAFTALTSISVMDEDGPMRSDPLAPNTFADYPPRRTKADAESIIAESLAEYGVDPLEQDLDESEHALSHLGGEADITKSFLEALWAEQIRQNALDTLEAEYDVLDPSPPFNIDAPSGGGEGETVSDGGMLTVTVEEIVDGFKTRTGTAFEELPDGVLIDEEYVELIETEDDDDDDSLRGTGGTPVGEIRIADTDTELTITDKGIRAVLEQADEDWRPETEKHNEVLRRAFVVFSAIGMEVTIVRQEHEESLPDAIAFPPIESKIKAKRASKVLDRFEKEYPIAAELSNGGAVTIEAETATYKKPARTLQNLARSVRNDRKTMFITPAAESDESAEPAARVNHILTDPMFTRGHIRMRPNEDPEEVDDLQNRTPMELYYNKTDYLQLGTPTDGERKHAVIERGEQAVWTKTDDNELTLYNGMSDAEEQGKLRIDERFGSTNAFEAWCRLDTHNNEWVVYPGGRKQRYDTLGDLKEDWQLVYEPFVPEREFQDVPGEEAWDIVQTPLPDFLSPAGGADSAEESDESSTDSDSTEEISNIAEVPEDAVLDQEQEKQPAEGGNESDAERAGFTREAVPIPEALVPEEMPSRAEDTSGKRSVSHSNQVHEAPPEAFESLFPDEHLDDYRGLTALAVEGNDADPVGLNEDSDETADDSDGEATAETEVEDVEVDAEISDDGFEVEDTDDEGTIDILGDEDGDTSDESGAERIAEIEFDQYAAMDDLNDNYIANDTGGSTDPEDIEIDDEAVADRFGSKKPTTRTFWTRVWEAASVDETKPIYRERLPGAVQHAGTRRTQVSDAVQLGLASGELVPAGEEEDAVRLPGPRDAYREHLEDEQITKMQRRDNWTAVWNALGHSPENGIDIPGVIMGLRATHDLERVDAKAAIGAGVDAGVIIEDGKQLALGDRTVPTFWSALLDEYNRSPHDSFTEQECILGLTFVHDLSEDQAHATLERGREHGIVYTEDHYYINTPRDDRGPEIAEEAFDPDAYPPSDDAGNADNSDDGDDDDGSGSSPDAGTEESPESTNENTGQSTTETTDKETTEQTESGGDEPATESTSTADTTPSDEPTHDEGQQESDSTPGEQPTNTDTTETTSEAESRTATNSETYNESENQDSSSETESEETITDQQMFESSDDETTSDETGSDSAADSATQSESSETSGADQTADGEPRAEPNSALIDTDLEELRLKPKPDLGAVQACLEEAALFFHDQLDREIEHNVEWNQERAFEEGYRKPETPREYFTSLEGDDPAYPVERDPEAADAMPAHRDEQPTGIQSVDDAETKVASPNDFMIDGKPYQYLGADHRGWSDSIVDQKQLGWAPVFGKELFYHLEEAGFAHHTMIATGLFTKPRDAYGENSDGEGYVDYTQVDEPKDLSCLFRGRYIFPYHDEDGQVAFFIGRQPDFDTEHGIHPEDFTKGKYAKLATTKNYTIVDEPIYGRETIRDGEPLVITEGMADAITAHAHGIPCISPVTKTFKIKQRETLADIIRSHQIPDVYFLQDSDPPKRVVLDEDDRDHDERACRRAMNIRELFCTGEFPGPSEFTAKTAVSAAANDLLEEMLEDHDICVAPPADPEKDADEETQVTADEVPVHLLTTDADRPRDTGPISEVIEIYNHGPGVDSAVDMGRVLDTHTPSPDETFTGTVQAAADVYREEVIEGDADPEEDDYDLWEEVARRLDVIEVDTETDGEATTKDDADQASLEEPDRFDYGGTNVWLIELPQFGDEKRDLDDYLQNGWLALAPPADWALRLSMEDSPSVEERRDGHTTAPAWMQALTQRADPVADYPTGMETNSLTYPVANDLLHTVGSLPYAAAGDDFPVKSPYVINSDPEADSDELQAAHRHPVADAADLRQDNNALTPAPESPDVYPPLSLFGVIPTIHPTQHPAASGNVSGLVNSDSDSAIDVDPQEIEDRVEEADYKKLTGKHNPIWSLELRDLGLNPGSRGKNPFGHFGESENYFVVIDDDFAYCHKREAVYNFQHFALCDMGHRDGSTSAKGQTLEDYEYFLLWKYARQNGLVPEHTPIPLKGLVGYAIKHDFCDPADLEQFDAAEGPDEGEDGDGSGSDEKALKRNLKLPDDVYFPVLKDIEEETGYTPARLDNSGSREDQTGHGDGPAEAPDVDPDEAIREDALERFGNYYRTGDEWPEPMEQFLTVFVEIDDEISADRDRSSVTPVSDIRDAYNAWAQITLEDLRQDPEKSADEAEVKTYPPGGFSTRLKSALNNDHPKRKVTIEGRGRPRCYFGISLTDQGEQLAQLEGLFAEDE
ncbi:type IV secretion system DNA-binding domain-containing protein [Natronorubrum thiooxidans]|uniref:DNA primase catalytic core, N-terminal domain n=1 Tax=Natronorubrum thiooxidans TaxID=308853 RepID=A0A1N7GVS8_9EURY|nr:type IV secretion system DNA-binding domain-containing protein [Natronorubrum thiooxidans]SIS16697.1 DNA primase catalytic core, N-terminal domain [Natronorubrum thiooxidans]